MYNGNHHQQEAGAASTTPVNSTAKPVTQPKESAKPQEDKKAPPQTGK